MDREEARAKLDMYLSYGGIIPIFDCVVYRHTDQKNGIQVDYTFRHLLCIAYDLKDAKGTDQEV